MDCALFAIMLYNKYFFHEANWFSSPHGTTVRIKLLHRLGLTPVLEGVQRSLVPTYKIFLNVLLYPLDFMHIQYIFQLEFSLLKLLLITETFCFSDIWGKITLKFYTGNINLKMPILHFQHGYTVPCLPWVYGTSFISSLVIVIMDIKWLLAVTQFLLRHLRLLACALNASRQQISHAFVG